MEKKIATPMSEIRSDLKIIHGEMLKVKKVVQDGNDQIAKELSEIKDKTMQTFNIVVDKKYKVYVLCMLKFSNTSTALEKCQLA